MGWEAGVGSAERAHQAGGRRPEQRCHHRRGADRLSDDPGASMSEIARVAGVGRVTLYGHFADRKELVGAVFARTMDRAEAELAAVDIEQDTWNSLRDLVQSSWRVLHQFNSLLAAAERYLSADQIRAHHDKPLARVMSVLEKGRSEGIFRADQSLAWQAACFYAVLHSAAAEIRAGRLDGGRRRQRSFRQRSGPSWSRRRTGARKSRPDLRGRFGPGTR